MDRALRTNGHSAPAISSHPASERLITPFAPILPEEGWPTAGVVGVRNPQSDIERIRDPQSAIKRVRSKKDDDLIEFILSGKYGRYLGR